MAKVRLAEEYPWSPAHWVSQEVLEPILEEFSSQMEPIRAAQALR